MANVIRMFFFTILLGLGGAVVAPPPAHAGLARLFPEQEALRGQIRERLAVWVRREADIRQRGVRRGPELNVVRRAVRFLSDSRVINEPFSQRSLAGAADSVEGVLWLTGQVQDDDQLYKLYKELEEDAELFRKLIEWRLDNEQ